MIKFGGTLIPNHFVGLQAEGNLPSGGLGLGYNVGVGNGRSTSLSRSGDSGDINNNRAWVASVYARPSRWYGFQVGGSVYHDKLNPLSGRDFDEWITSADVVWTKNTPNSSRNSPMCTTAIRSRRRLTIPRLSIFNWGTGFPGRKTSGSRITASSIFIDPITSRFGTSQLLKSVVGSLVGSTLGFV